MNRKQRRAAKSAARKQKVKPSLKVIRMNIAQLKGQQQSLEREHANAIVTMHRTSGALDLIRHQIAQMEHAATIAAEAEKAKAEAAAAEAAKDAPPLDTNHV